MVFNSYIFILCFLPLAVVGYYGLNKIKMYNIAKIYLIIMSLWFYGYFNPSYLFIILASILVNYIFSRCFRKVESKGWRRVLLVGGLALNIAVLFYFKYYNFFLENLNLVFKTDFTLIKLILPLGISFFTFQQLSYLVDSYKGTVPDYHIVDYALFVTFFPQLVAGPIVLHSEIIPQFEDKKNRVVNYENLSKGIYGIAFGLIKKVIIADTLGAAVSWGYGNLGSLHTVNAIIVTLSYTLQIYFDFSGYCDIATGIGYLFNVKLPMNFNSPYKSLTIEEFWKRWHMSLTRFFTAYIYIPLGGNRKGKIITYINTFIVFFISGIWHGANWTFILWGILHGIAVITNKIFRKQINKLHPAANWIITFIFVNVAWIYFRAPSIGVANQIVKNIAKLDFKPISSGLINSFMLPEITFIRNFMGINSQYFAILIMLIFLVGGLFIVLNCKNTNERIEQFKPSVINSVIVIVFMIWTIVSFSGISTFLYFNF